MSGTEKVSLFLIPSLTLSLSRSSVRGLGFQFDDDIHSFRHEVKRETKKGVSIMKAVERRGNSSPSTMAVILTIQEFRWLFLLEN